MTETQTEEPGEVTANAFHARIVATWPSDWAERGPWMGMPEKSKADWSAAERAARTSGPLYEACKAWRKACHDAGRVPADAHPTVRELLVAIDQMDPP